MQRGSSGPASRVRDRTLARKGGKGPEMTINFAVEAAWALNRTRLEMEAGGQQTRASTDAGREKKVRIPQGIAKRADDGYPEG